MDISSLPNEMLTVVLKYTKFGRLTKLRKINNRIDVLARRSKLNERRVSVDTFELGREGASYVLKIHFKKEEAKDLDLKIPIVVPVNDDLAKTLEQYLPLVAIEREFSFGRYVHFSKEALTMLHIHKKSVQKVTQLRFCTGISKFCFAFPNADNLIIDECSLVIGRIIASRKRTWKKLQLNFKDDRKNMYIINNRFLHDAALKCREIVIRANKTSFSLDGILQLIEKCIAVDGSFDRKFDLGLIDVKRTPFLTKHELICETFDSLDGLTISLERIGDTLQICKLAFGNSVDAPYLQFSFVENDDNLY